MSSRFRASILLLLVVVSSSRAEPLHDRYGDPLPDGAVARLGYANHRAANSRVQFSPDGQEVLVLTWGRYLTAYDVKTGRFTRRLTIPAKPVVDGYLFPDGKRALRSGRGGNRRDGV